MTDSVVAGKRRKRRGSRSQDLEEMTFVEALAHANQELIRVKEKTLELSRLQLRKILKRETLHWMGALKNVR